MDNVFEAVYAGDFAFTAFIGAAGDDHFVVFADGDGADLRGEGGLVVSSEVIGERRGDMYIVFFAEFFVERRAHDHSSDAGWGIEVGFTCFPPRGVESYCGIQLATGMVDG